MTDIVLGFGRDGRVVAEYLARRKRMRDWTMTPSTDDINDIWLDMARKYKCRVRELKDILNRYQAQRGRPLNPPVRIRPAKVCGCGETEWLKWTVMWFWYDEPQRWMCPACIERAEVEYG